MCDLLYLYMECRHHHVRCGHPSYCTMESVLTGFPKQTYEGLGGLPDSTVELQPLTESGEATPFSSNL